MTELFRDLAERDEPRTLTSGLWARRAVMTVVLVVVGLALAGVFGQRASTSSATAPAASMSVNAPRTLRGGLLWAGRVEIRAARDIDHPYLLLDRGWVEGMQISSITPTPPGQGMRAGRVVLSYPALHRGDQLTIWLQLQVDPTETGSRPMGVELADGSQRLVAVHRTITVLP